MSNTKIVYCYSEHTGLFIGTDTAYRAPIGDDWLIPGGSTNKPVPNGGIAPQGFAYMYLDSNGEVPEYYPNGEWYKVKLDDNLVDQTEKLVDQDEIDEMHVLNAVKDSLNDADIMINKLEDLGYTAKNIRSWRVALRDVNHQPGYPNNIEWPKLELTKLQKSVLYRARPTEDTAE